jgi:hypothetical protein
MLTQKAEALYTEMELTDENYDPGKLLVTEVVGIADFTVTSLLAPGDPGGLGTRTVNFKTWRLGQVTLSTGASAPRIINL